MKFIHLADCHLGDSFNFKSGLSAKIRKNNKKSLENILNNNDNLDFLLIAGDLYERSFFTLKDYKELFKSIENFNRDIFYVAGNHDYIAKDNEGILRMKPDNLHIFTSTNLNYYEIDSTRIYGLSYNDRIFTGIFPYDIKLDKNYFNILLLHGVINDSESSYLNLNLDKLKALGFDYVALGHIHKREDFGDNIYYSGSIEPRDFTDSYDYGYLIYDNGDINYVNSSIMKFYDLSLNVDDFNNEQDMMTHINSLLDDDKENYLRLNLDKDISKKRLKKELDVVYLDLKINKELSFNDLVNLYPNSLLEKYQQKFPDDPDKIQKRALEIGLDAIYRSRDD